MSISSSSSATPATPATDLRRARHAQVEVLALGLAALLAVVLLQPTAARDGLTLFGVRLPESCGAKRLGASCPGCGLTRSVVLAARLEPSALALNPVGPVVLLLLVGQVPWRLWRLARLRRGRAEDPLPGLPWGALVAGLGVALVAVWLARLALGLPAP